MRKIYYNREEKEYTFSEYSNEKMNLNVIPPKFSPVDKFGAARRKAKKLEET